MGGAHRLTKGAVVVMERRVRMSVRNDTDVTIVLTRACTLMSCPAAGGAADAIVCHNGQCVTTACGALDPGDGDAPNDTPCSGFFTCCNGVGNGCPPRVGGDGG